MRNAPGAVTLYEALLAAYPQEVRDEYGDDMVQLFADRYRDERPGGDVLRFARFWGGMFGDLVRTAFTERTETVVANFKQQWWKWTIGLVAAFEGVRGRGNRGAGRRGGPNRGHEGHRDDPRRHAVDSGGVGAGAAAAE